jgi:hypothetical protein
MKIPAINGLAVIHSWFGTKYELHCVRIGYDRVKGLGEARTDVTGGVWKGAAALAELLCSGVSL